MGNSLLQGFSRFFEYQSWFIPLIWLYWPTKTHKQQNMRRVRAVKELTTTRKKVAVQRGTLDDEDNQGGYTSLDGESYLDYDSQSDLSYNQDDMMTHQESSRGSTANDARPLLPSGLGFAQQSDIFIVG